jgi:hypothetical protein
LVVVVIFVTHRHRVDDDKKTFETLPRDFLYRIPLQVTSSETK